MLFPKSLLFSIPLAILSIEDESDRQLVLELYQRYKLNMYYMALRIVNDPAIAEELVQESCLVIIRKLDRIKAVEVCKRKKYIVSLVKNVSVNYVVKRNRQSKYSFSATDDLLARQIDPNSDVESELFRNCDIEMTKRALMQLSEKDRNILRMRYDDDLCDAEIAEYLAIKANSARYYLTLARRRLKKAMMEMEEE